MALEEISERDGGMGKRILEVLEDLRFETYREILKAIMSDYGNLNENEFLAVAGNSLDNLERDGILIKTHKGKRVYYLYKKS